MNRLPRSHEYARLKPKRSNCLLWALLMRHMHGGRIKLVSSDRWILGFHVEWIDEDGQRYCYLPYRFVYGGRKLAWWKSWAVIWFPGYVAVAA